MKEVEIKIAAFLANPKLKVRSGVPFTVTEFHRDGNGNVTALAGTITETAMEAGAPVEKVIPMLWTSNGNAMCNQPMLYDLIEELPIADLGQ